MITSTPADAARKIIPRARFFTSSTLVHLRLPFFFYLSPIFIFSAAVSPVHDWLRTGLAFFILHFLLYPSSNGFNTYYDRDERSIGGIRIPPKVTPDLLLAVNLLDLAALCLSFLLGWFFAVGVLCYALGSRLYSWSRTRLKKRPILSWLMVGLGQGTGVFLISYQAINQAGIAELLDWKVLGASVLAGILLLGAYPMTQVYQHEEDRKHGDLTMSLLLGIRGTFVFCSLFQAVAAAGFTAYFWLIDGPMKGLLYLVCLAPMLVYFIRWQRMVARDPGKADFRMTMGQNFITSLSLNLFFLLALFVR